jgi:RHS repeat-associated protein
VVPGKTYYTYDSFGNMETLVLPTGASMKMEYDSRGQMLSMKDGKGNVIQAFTYYENGLTKTETDTSGTSQYFYNDLGDLTKSIDPDGSITTMTYDFNGKLKRMVEDNGTPNDLTDDEVSTFDYDKLGREKLADYGNGIWVKYDYKGAGGDWSKLEAPTIGKMERKLTADGKLAGWVTPSGGTPTFIYDNAGRLWKETEASGVVTTEYSYDQAGRVSRIKDVRTGAVASKKYDLGNRITEEIDPLLGFVKYEYDIPRNGGKLKSTTRGQYVRNGAGDLVVDTTVALQTTSYEYNGSRTSLVDPLGRRTTSVLDEYLLPIETIFENRSGKDYKITQSYLYANNLQEAKDYPTRIIDIGGNDRVYTYDTNGKLKTATDLGDGVYNYTYGDNGLALLESPLSQTKSGANKESVGYTYDDLGNLASVKYSGQLARTMTYRATDNRLNSTTLANGDSVTYAYNDAGQVTTQTGTGVGATTMTYNAGGAVKTVTDSTGTTTYSYDALTSQLSRIDNSNGSSIAYTYDLAGRVKTQTEQGTSTGVGYTTEYTYDTFGNLKSVKDPTNGITTMKYDTLNRLTTRDMPNGVTTTWTYDALDRIQSVTHKNGSTILAAVSYERKDSGEPSKITREDGTYTKLLYDTALRITKESFYNAQNVLLDETTYVYDAAGKRIAKVTALDNQTYNYDKGYQLDSITGTNPEDYAYDTNGRVDLIQRDGQTLNLDHDVYDRLTAVKNLTSSTTTNYVYDGQGHRITATNGSTTRKFLVAPVMGGGLDSTDMMLDGAGNVTANYVYGGGSSPFMKLDANGNPVYYLSDGMGSVIGLANQSGQNAAKFSYDAFGNIRSQSGTMADSTGGDFRFQGQWLESATGIYNFRARNYDSKTGTFLSRDPVDPNEQLSEAMNPYQAMYSNPYLYSDPSGAFTMIELNTSMTIQNILNASRAYMVNYFRQRAIDKARGFVMDLAFSAIRAYLPFDISGWIGAIKFSNGNPFEIGQGNSLQKLLTNAFCKFLGNSDILWAEPKILGTPNLSARGRGYRVGDPLTNGLNCSGAGSKFGGIPRLGATAYPDLIFSNTPPSQQAGRNDREGFLIVDFKRSTKQALDLVGKVNKTQWRAIKGYAQNHQLIPIVYLPTYMNNANVADIATAGRNAITQGVIVFITAFKG